MRYSPTVYGISADAVDPDTAIAGRRMEELSSALDICAPLLTGKILHLDYPVHCNVGDLLIWMGEMAFFARHGIKSLGAYSILNIGTRARRLLDECSTICFHGGGNFGDLWPDHHKFRERLIRQYPHKRIVMLPQSVHFGDADEMDYTCGILKTHPDLHIFLRDRQSLALLRDKGMPNLRLCPDMAHALWGIVSAPQPTSASPLYLLRRDKERFRLPPDVIAHHAASVDWPDILTGSTERAYRWGTRIVQIDGHPKIDNRLPAHLVWSISARVLIRRAIDLFAPHQSVISNRLHAIILSALLGRNALAFDNSYGKISSYVDCWLSDMPTIDLHCDPWLDDTDAEFRETRPVKWANS